MLPDNGRVAAVRRAEIPVVADVTINGTIINAASAFEKSRIRISSQ